MSLHGFVDGVGNVGKPDFFVEECGNCHFVGGIEDGRVGFTRLKGVKCKLERRKTDYVGLFKGERADFCKVEFLTPLSVRSGYDRA